MYGPAASFVPALPLARPARLRQIARQRPRCCAAKPSPSNGPARAPAGPSAPRHPQPERAPALGTEPDTGSADGPAPAPAPAPEIAGTVTFLAVANEFDIPQLLRRLLRDSPRTGVLPSAIGSVLRLQRRAAAPGRLAEAFVFAYGCLVVWGPDDDDCERFLAAVLGDALAPRAEPVVDSMYYTFGAARPLRRDVVVLQAPQRAVWPTGDGGEGDDGDALRPELERLAVSCALAQSVKLAAFEGSMRATIENTRHLPDQLAATGVISASQRDVSRLMGRLFLDRYRYHLSGDLLVTPAFFWDHEQYLPAYRRVERYLEVRERGDLLDKRVGVVHELYTLLGNEIATQNGMALEFAITAMIAFEILLTLVTLARDSMTSVFWGFSLFFGVVVLAWAVWRFYRRTRFSPAARPPLMQAMGDLGAVHPD